MLTYFPAQATTFTNTDSVTESEFDYCCECHAPQVAPLGHTWSHWCSHRNFQFLYFQLQIETQPEVDVMKLREAAIYGRSYTEYFSFPFDI